MKYYYIYVLKSQVDNKLYIGFTSNLKQRLSQHRNGLVHATKNKLPVCLIYFEGCLNEKNAIIREKQLKTGFGRAYLKRRLN